MSEEDNVSPIFAGMPIPSTEEEEVRDVRGEEIIANIHKLCQEEGLKMDSLIVMFRREENPDDMSLFTTYEDGRHIRHELDKLSQYILNHG